MLEDAAHQIWAVGIWVTWVIWCFTKKLCTRCDAWAGMLSWWSCQSPVAHSCSLLNHPNSFSGGMFKLNAKSDAYLLLSLLGLFECNSHTVHMLNGVYCPYWLVQWSHHCSCMCIPVHSPWLPDYMYVVQTNSYINNGWSFSGQASYFLIPPSFFHKRWHKCSHILLFHLTMYSGSHSISVYRYCSPFYSITLGGYLSTVVQSAILTCELCSLLLVFCNYNAKMNCFGHTYSCASGVWPG